MEKYSSWQVFIIAIGFLVIVTAPMYDEPMVVIIEGLSIILIGVIWLRFNEKKKKMLNKKYQRRK